MLTLIDEYSRQCLRVEVARKLRGHNVVSALSEVMAQRGLPKYIRSDNGSEFIAKDVQHWLREMGIKTIYIDPGSPWSRGRGIASFHNRLRDECLNQELFPSVTEARVVIEELRHLYNRVHPHSKWAFKARMNLLQLKLNWD